VYVSGGLQDGDLVALTILGDALPGMSVKIGKRTSTLRQEQLMEAAGATPTSAPPAAEATPDQSSRSDSLSDQTDRATAV
jgi:hypothetical protein